MIKNIILTIPGICAFIWYLTYQGWSAGSGEQLLQTHYVKLYIYENSYVDINHNVLSLYCFAFEKGVLLAFIRFCYSALSMISTITLKLDNGSTMICRLNIGKDLAVSIFTLVLRFKNTFQMLDIW